MCEPEKNGKEHDLVLHIRVDNYKYSDAVTIQIFMMAVNWL
jgi:hypothetical protein